MLAGIVNENPFTSPIYSPTTNLMMTNDNMKYSRLFHYLFEKDIKNEKCTIICDENVEYNVVFLISLTTTVFYDSLKDVLLKIYGLNDNKKSLLFICESINNYVIKKNIKTLSQIYYKYYK